jgi:hypothetical protein
MTATDQQQRRPINRQTITTIAQAFSVLGIRGGVSSQEEINAAFRAKVKAAATGTGSYTGDMDSLTQAKKVLTAALTKALEQAGIDQARQRAKQQEQEERERAKARPRPQAEQKEEQREQPQPQQQQPTPEPLRLGPGSPAHLARRAYELQQARQREQTRRVWTWNVSREQARRRQEQRLTCQQHKRGGEIVMQPQPQQGQPEQRNDGQELQPQQEARQAAERGGDGDDTIQGALLLYRQRQTELEQARQREQAMQKELSQIQAQRQKLETTVQTASQLAEQLHAILTRVNDDTPTAAGTDAATE